MWLSLECPLLGTRPTTQAFALTGNQKSDTLVARLALNPLSHTSQGYTSFFLPVHFLGIFFFKPSPSVCVGVLFCNESLVGSTCAGHVFLSIQVPYVFKYEHFIDLYLTLLLILIHVFPFVLVFLFLSLFFFIFLKHSL